MKNNRLIILFSKKKIEEELIKLQKKIQLWVTFHYFQLAIFNVILLFLILLRSAGYFEPVLTLSINLIVFTAIFLAIILFQAGSKAIFSISILFLLIAMFFRSIAILEVWAERTMVYGFEAIILGLLMLVIENINNRGDK